MATPFSSAHFELLVDEERNVVRLVRSDEPFHSVAEMIAVLDDIFAAVASIDGKEYGLIVDNRKGPSRDDPAFQKAFRSFRVRLDERFARVGVVLASEESVKRLEEVGPSANVRAYTDEASALGWAAEGRE